MYVNLSPLATVSLKTHILNDFVLSPTEGHQRHCLQVGSPGRGPSARPAAAQAAWLPHPGAYEWGYTRSVGLTALWL